MTYKSLLSPLLKYTLAAIDTATRILTALLLFESQAATRASLADPAMPEPAITTSIRLPNSQTALRDRSHPGGHCTVNTLRSASRTPRRLSEFLTKEAAKVRAAFKTCCRRSPQCCRVFKPNRFRLSMKSPRRVASAIRKTCRVKPSTDQLAAGAGVYRGSASPNLCAQLHDSTQLNSESPP